MQTCNFACCVCVCVCVKLSHIRVETEAGSVEKRALGRCP